MRVPRLMKALARAKRAANKANKVLSPPRVMQLPILQRLVEVLRERRQTALETTGNTGRWLLKLIISEQIKHFPWLTRHMVNHYIATHPDSQQIGTFVVTNSNNETVVSGLTDSSLVARAMRDNAVITEPHLQQTPTPTDVSITATESTDLTSKVGGGDPREALLVQSMQGRHWQQRHLTNVPLRLPVSSTLLRRIQTDLAGRAVYPEVPTRKQLNFFARNATWKGVSFQWKLPSAEPRSDES
jgi:hypothetical protein